MTTLGPAPLLRRGGVADPRARRSATAIPRPPARVRWIGIAATAAREPAAAGSACAWLCGGARRGTGGWRSRPWRGRSSCSWLTPGPGPSTFDVPGTLVTQALRVGRADPPPVSGSHTTRGGLSTPATSGMPLPGHLPPGSDESSRDETLTALDRGRLSGVRQKPAQRLPHPVCSGTAAARPADETQLRIGGERHLHGPGRYLLDSYADLLTDTQQEPPRGEHRGASAHVAGQVLEPGALRRLLQRREDVRRLRLEGHRLRGATAHLASMTGHAPLLTRSGRQPHAAGLAAAPTARSRP